MKKGRMEKQVQQLKQRMHDKIGDVL